MIETTLGALLLAEPALDRLGALVLANQKLSYDLAKLIRLVKVETAQATKQRQALLTEYYDCIDEATGRWQIKPGAGKLAEYQAKLEELAAVPVTLAVHPLSRAHLETEVDVDKKPVRISGADAHTLGPLLPEEEGT